MKWSKTPRCAAGVTLTATDTIASPRAEFLLGQWSRAVTPAEPRACLYTGLPVPPPRGASRPGLQHSSKRAAFPPGRSSARGWLHLVILFLCLGWLFTVPKQQKKGSIKSKAPSSKPRAELAPPNTGTSTCAAHHQPHRRCRLVVERPFQITQENFKGKGLPGGLLRQEAPHTTAPAPPKSPVLSSFLFPTSRSSLQNAHATSAEPGHPTPSRHLQSLLQKAELVRSEPSGRHDELFHPASPQLFYPSTFKNNGAIQLFKTKVVCFFPVVVGGLVCSCHQDKNKRP